MFWVSGLTCHKYPRSLFQWVASRVLGHIQNKCLGSRIPPLRSRVSRPGSHLWVESQASGLGFHFLGMPIERVPKCSFILVVWSLHSRTSSDKRPQCSFKFEASRCDTYRRELLKRGRHFFQSEKSHSYGTSNFCHCFFPNDSI